MNQQISMLALVVRDYDEAIDYYTKILGFELIEDTKMSPEKRWVVISPVGSDGCRILLAKAANENQTQCIGNQTGGRVFLFLHTDDFYRDYHHMLEKGVKFIDSPREEEYGTVIVFEDLYGNKWDFIQPKTPSTSTKTTENK